MSRSSSKNFESPVKTYKEDQQSPFKKQPTVKYDKREDASLTSNILSEVYRNSLYEVSKKQNTLNEVSKKQSILPAKNPIMQKRKKADESVISEFTADLLSNVYR